MKKLLLKILTGALVLCMLVSSLAACSSQSWGGTTMTNWGSVKSFGGFLAETEHYVYYINGEATATDDNTFGAPIKGTLMAAQKSDLSKTEIVVPKLFAATEYDAGLFIDGGFVYYGTTSLDKTSDGSVANDELVFMKTSLEGKDSEELVKVGALSTEYRIVKGGDKVYIVYYDATETALVSFDTVAKTKTIIAKTDAKTESDFSLDKYTFVTTAENDIAVLYTVTVYSEPYISSKVEDKGYSRATESYNNLYAYKAGDVVDTTTGLAGTLIGSEEGYKYEVKYADGMVFYSETTTAATATAKTFGDTAKNIYANKKGVEIVNDSYVADTSVILSLDEVYSVADGKVYKSTLLGDDKTTKEVIAADSTISSVLKVTDKDVYFISSENKIMRVAKGDATADVVQISDDTVSVAWYAPEFVDVNGKEHLFYLDNSSLGASYVKYVDVTAAPTTEDTDDDGEADKFYLTGKTIGKITDADSAKIVEAKVSAISSSLENGVLVMEKVDGALTAKAVTDARAAYNALSDEAKKLFSEDSLATLGNYEKAVEMANVYAKLDGIYGYENKTTAEKDALKDAYNQVKDAINEFKNLEKFSTISAYIENNLKWNFQRAEELFEAKA